LCTHVFVHYHLRRLFFLLRRLPPRSTLFPYTTLFRSVALASGYVIYQTSNVIHQYRTDQHVAAALGLFAAVALLFWYILQILLRSEEHTSELQSPCNLVCRLLLEKKKHTSNEIRHYLR